MVKFATLVTLLAVAFAATGAELEPSTHFIKVRPGPSVISPSEHSALSDEDLGLKETYRHAIAAVVREAWRGKEWPLQKACEVELVLLPGGEIIRADMSACGLPEEAQKEMLALLAPHPTPYYGFQRIFSRTASVVLIPLPVRR